MKFVHNHVCLSITLSNSICLKTNPNQTPTTTGLTVVLSGGHSSAHSGGLGTRGTTAKGPLVKKDSYVAIYHQNLKWK